METNLLNYYNDSIKDNVEVIGYIYDLSEDITFKKNTTTEENVVFYCLKLFAVKKDNKWLLTNGFVKVAIRPVPLGSFVRLKGVLSKSTRNEDTNCLNLVKFRKEKKNWLIDPIKPQQINEAKLPITVLSMFKHFKEMPILYNTDYSVDYNILPKDIDSRIPIAKTSYISDSLPIAQLEEGDKLVFQPFIPTVNKPTSLYTRLLKELVSLDMFTLDTISLSDFVLESFQPTLKVITSIKGYSDKPKKGSKFYKETSEFKIRGVPHIELTKPRITIY